MRVPSAPRVPSPSHVAATARLIAARHRALVRLAQASGVLAVALALWSAQSAVQSEKRSWGATTTVLVTTRDLAPGDAIGPTDVEIARWPLAVAPPSAVDQLEPGVLVRQRVDTGDALTRADVARSPGPAGLLPRGWRGVDLHRGE